MSVKRRIERLEGPATDKKRLLEHIKFFNGLKESDGSPSLSKPLTLADFPEDYRVETHEEFLRRIQEEERNAPKKD